MLYTNGMDWYWEFSESIFNFLVSAFGPFNESLGTFAFLFSLILPLLSILVVGIITTRFVRFYYLQSRDERLARQAVEQEAQQVASEEAEELT